MREKLSLVKIIEYNEQINTLEIIINLFGSRNERKTFVEEI